MNIARFAVTRPVAVTMQIAALVLLGVICLLRLPVDLLPKVTIPTVVITTEWPNVAPEEIESQITRPIEQAVSSTPGLYQVTSTTSTGSSSVRVQFNWGEDIGQAAIDIMQRLERAKRGFPVDATLRPPTVTRFDPNQAPILSVGVTGESNPVRLRTLLDNQIIPLIESADGVASVTVTGGRTRSILVDVDPVRLRAHNLSLADVVRRLMQENLNAPAGIARQSDTEYTIRAQGWLSSLDELRRLPLTARDGRQVFLEQVANVRDAYQEPRVLTRMDGEPSAGFSVSKQADANTITTADAVKERIERVKRLYPQLRFSVTYDQSKFVQQAVNDLIVNAIIGAVLAVLILLFFLRNLRSTIVVAMAIPISIVSTFALVYLGGFTLNTMSLSGLALATGLIVDDAVVVLENIFRHIERDKKTPFQAAISGASEILSAVIASTWTVMIVFLPLLLIKGQAGQMFTQFALVVIFSLAVSLLDAVTIVPMLAHRLISGEAHAEMREASQDHPSLRVRLFVRFGRWFDALDASYRNGLQWALRHRVWTAGAAIAVTGASLLLLPYVGAEMMPATDSGDINIDLRLPPGTALAKTDRVMQQAEQIVMQHPDVATVFATIGAGGRRGGGLATSNQGTMTVRLKEDRKRSTNEIIDELRRQLSALPGVRPRVSAFDIVSRLMSGGDQSIEVVIFGNDLSTLSRLSRDLMQRIREVPGLQNLDVNWQESMPEVQWRVDRQKAAQLGVSFRDVSDTINTATNGSIATYYQEDGYQYPIVVQLPEADRKTVDAMANMQVSPASGNRPPVTLRQVAFPVFGVGPSQITRQDRQRFISVVGVPQGRPINDIQQDIERALSDMRMPSGYTWSWGTAQQRQQEEYAGMGLAVILAIGIIYMLLAAQFESLTHPLAILLSVPLAATGVILGLFLTGRPFGLTALIGVLMLVGIVVKNGILLVDYTNTLRRHGLERDDAVLTAAPTRLRPILMTASATLLGLLPLALGIGKGSEVQAPMATAVIGGLTTSTLLTLFVVPVAYTLLDDLSGRRRRIDRMTPEDDAQAIQE